MNIKFFEINNILTFGFNMKMKTAPPIFPDLSMRKGIGYSFGLPCFYFSRKDLFADLVVGDKKGQDHEQGKNCQFQSKLDGFHDILLLCCVVHLPCLLLIRKQIK